jgi:hypothetical protein
MTVYVLRGDKLVPKERTKPDMSENVLSCPMISRFEVMESPVTGREVTSWRDRDRDMDAVGAVDPRDLPRAPFEKRNEENARRQQLAADQRRDAT